MITLLSGINEDHAQNACIAEEAVQDCLKILMDNQDHVIDEDVNVDDKNILNENIVQIKAVEGSSDHSSAMMSSYEFDNTNKYYDGESFDDEKLNKTCSLLEHGEDPFLDCKDELDSFFHNEGE